MKIRRHRRDRRARGLATIAIAALALVGGGSCGASAGDSASMAPKADAPRGAGGAGGGGGAKGPGSGGDGEGAGALPPEKKVEAFYRSPVATGRYVWIANPRSGRVAFVDAASLDVRVVDAGNAPTYLAPVPSATGDAAIVLNVLSNDATLFRAADGRVESRTFKTARAANAWAVSGDGRWAIAWADARLVDRASRVQGFQDVTVIDLTEKLPPTILAVGYRPVRVGFTSDGARAYAVTQDGISMIDLRAPAGPLVTASVATSDDPRAEPAARDVAVTPDGKYAFVRREKRPEVVVVALDTGARTTVTLPGNVTDLDLAEGGTKALAVVRDRSEIDILPVPGITSSPTSFVPVRVEGETIGSVVIAPTGSTALLYTSAAPIERMTVLSLPSGDVAPKYRVVRLYAPVLAVFSTRDAKHAVVLHDPSKSTDGKSAFSVVPIGSALPAKIVGAEGPVTAVALSPSNDRAIVTERDDAKRVFGAYLARFPALSVDRYPLASPPIAVGVVAGARRAYVAQEHAEGRLTFIDLDTGNARTLTGFELSSRVVDGSKP